MGAGLRARVGATRPINAWAQRAKLTLAALPQRGHGGPPPLCSFFPVKGYKSRELQLLKLQQKKQKRGGVTTNDITREKKKKIKYETLKIQIVKKDNKQTKVDEL